MLAAPAKGVWLAFCQEMKAVRAELILPTPHHVWHIDIGLSTHVHLRTGSAQSATPRPQTEVEQRILVRYLALSDYSRSLWISKIACHLGTQLGSSAVLR
jgi:hypothetical protein